MKNKFNRQSSAYIKSPSQGEFLMRQAKSRESRWLKSQPDKVNRRDNISVVEKMLKPFFDFHSKREADESYVSRTPIPKGFQTRMPFYRPKGNK
jgi:hypothetical protein